MNVKSLCGLCQLPKSRFNKTRPQLLSCSRLSVDDCKVWIHRECHSPEITAEDFLNIKKVNGDFGFTCAKCANVGDISGDLGNLHIDEANLSDPGPGFENSDANGKCYFFLFTFVDCS